MRARVKKMILVVIDGLRPDAITPEHLPVLHGLLRRGWRAGTAVTVRPSVTVAALTSLAAGVSPERHGLTNASLQSMGKIRGLKPLPQELRRLGVDTTVFTSQLSGSARWVAGALLRLGGVTRLLPTPPAPGVMLDGAMAHIERNPSPELVVLYLNDADVAGHAWGWMSPAYLQAARTIDLALERLEQVAEDPDTLVILTADHGGGGVLPQDHDHPHPVNEGIPLGMVGGRVIPGLVSPDPVRLLDIPPTVLHGFGGTAPAEYEGRVLHEAFMTELVWA
ncbi:MAG TPA: alkaline phosphatase family protein [Gemmatimonadales bacterium]|nr:alkaline phosphatase family protein [Gemmatimonadales bacterium]